MKYQEQQHQHLYKKDRNRTIPVNDDNNRDDNDNIYNEEDEDIYLVNSNNLNARQIGCDVLLPKLTVKKTVKFTENQGILFNIIILILSYIYFLYIP